MRKQITIPDNLEKVVKNLAKSAEISESAVISYGIHLLSNRLASAQAIDEVYNLIKIIKHFYKFYYIKALPRGKKCNHLSRK